MKTQLFSALRLTLAMLVLCCVLYPAIVWAAAQIAPGQGQGVQISRRGVTNDLLRAVARDGGNLDVYLVSY